MTERTTKKGIEPGSAEDFRARVCKREISLASERAGRLLELGMTREAEKILLEGIVYAGKEGGDDVELRKLLAELYLARNDTKRAKTQISAVLRKRSRDPELLSLAGNAYMADGDYMEAAGLFQEAILSTNGRPYMEDLLRCVTAYLKLDNVTEAMYLINLTITLYPEAEQPRAIKAAILNREYGEFHEAVRILRGCLKKMETPFIYSALGTVFLSNGWNEQSLVYLEKSLEMDPEQPDVLTTCAKVCLSMKKPRKAEELLRKAFKDLDILNIPKYVEPICVMVETETKLRNPDTAICMAKLILECMPWDRPDVYAGGVEALMRSIEKAGGKTKLRILEEMDRSAERACGMYPSNKEIHLLRKRIAEALLKASGAEKKRTAKRLEKSGRNGPRAKAAGENPDEKPEKSDEKKKTD